MDFIIPAIMIIAYNAGRKISAPLKTLIIASIFINYYGVISWFKSPC
jgi:translation elongation factor EF-4